MLDGLYENTHCPMCAAPFEYNLVGKIRECEYETTDQTFEVHQCGSCDTLALNPRPTERDLEIIYPSNYYAFAIDPNQEERPKGQKSFVQGLFLRIIKRGMRKRVAVHAPTPGGRPLRILDIGCGVGTQLDHLKLLFPDAETWGLDFGKQAVEKTRAKGHKAIEGTFEDSDLPEGYFDLIISLHVIEHVAKPDQFVAQALGLLHENGTLTIATPNIDCWDFKLLKRRHWGGYLTLPGIGTFSI